MSTNNQPNTLHLFSSPPSQQEALAALKRSLQPHDAVVFMADAALVVGAHMLSSYSKHDSSGIFSSYSLENFALKSMLDFLNTLKTSVSIYILGIDIDRIALELPPLKASSHPNKQNNKHSNKQDNKQNGKQNSGQNQQAPASIGYLANLIIIDDATWLELCLDYGRSVTYG